MEVDILVFLGLIGLLLAIILTLFGLALYSGLNYVPEVTSGPFPLPQCQIAYKFLKGAYGGSAVGATFTEATSIAPKARLLGIFYDNPQEIVEEKLRCVVGVVVSGTGMDALGADAMALLKEKGFSLHDLPGIAASVNTSFPHTTSLSIRLAPLRVYLRISAHIAEKDLCAYPMLELYGGKEILFSAPLSQQDSFFVPEALVESDSEPEDIGSDLMDEESSDGTSDPSETRRDSATESDFEQIDAAVKEEAA